MQSLELWNPGLCLVVCPVDSPNPNTQKKIGSNATHEAHERAVTNDREYAMTATKSAPSPLARGLWSRARILLAVCAVILGLIVSLQIFASTKTNTNDGMVDPFNVVGSEGTGVVWAGAAASFEAKLSPDGARSSPLRVNLTAQQVTTKASSSSWRQACAGREKNFAQIKAKCDPKGLMAGPGRVFVRKRGDGFGAHAFDAVIFFVHAVHRRLALAPFNWGHLEHAVDASVGQCFIGLDASSDHYQPQVRRPEDYYPKYVDKDVHTYFTPAVREMMRCFHFASPGPRVEWGDGAGDTDGVDGVDSGGVVRVAIHYRRGDLSHITDPRPNFKLRRAPQLLLTDSYYVSVMNFLRVTLGNRVRFHVFTDGVPSEYRIFENFTDTTVHATWSAYKCIDAMIRADILVMSRSSFSFTAGWMTRGAVIYPAKTPLYKFLRPAPHFFLATPDGVLCTPKAPENALGERLARLACGGPDAAPMPLNRMPKMLSEFANSTHHTCCRPAQFRVIGDRQYRIRVVKGLGEDGNLLSREEFVRRVQEQEAKGLVDDDPYKRGKIWAG